MSPITDTSAEVAAIVRDRMMKLTGAERFVIGARMFETARALVLASLPENLSEAELKRVLFKRFYGESLPGEAEKKSGDAPRLSDRNYM